MRVTQMAGGMVVLVLGLAVPQSARAQDPAVVVRTQAVYAAMQPLAASMLNAKAKILEATGFKELADEARAGAEAIGKLDPTKADKKNIDKMFDAKIISSGERADSALKAKAEVAEELSDAQKASIKEGAVEYLKGTAATVAVLSQVPELLSAVTSIEIPKNPLQAGKILGQVNAAKALATSVPKLVSLNVSTAKALVSYLKANKIEVAEANMDFGGTD